MAHYQMQYLILFEPKNLLPFKFFSLNDIQNGSERQKAIISQLCVRWIITDNWQDCVKGSANYVVYEGRGEGRDYLALLEDSRPKRKRTYPAF